ncbi:MAG: hypothetical protein ACLSFJ_08135 [Holdemania filiformis]
MKKITKFGVLATACMLLMQGCGAKEENYDSLLNPNKPVTLEIWTYYNGTQKAAFDELVTEFNETGCGEGNRCRGLQPGQRERSDH